MENSILKFTKSNKIAQSPELISKILDESNEAFDSLDIIANKVAMKLNSKIMNEEFKKNIGKN